jgi:hypothetical protein
MDLTRTAALSVIAGCVLGVVAAVAYFDWRAGVLTVGVLLVVGGLQSLRSTSG